ncbi:UNVERIFIED_CONTAM: hypothetical protein HDU68_000383 [Siphonaria sp. JEL0065]|nr:hypothetical protein HDU68_000383 [Siphonaria sp. JEL0065]
MDFNFMNIINGDISFIGERDVEFGGYFPFQLGTSSAGMNPFLIDSSTSMGMIEMIIDESPLLRNGEMVIGTPTMDDLLFQQLMDSGSVSDFNLKIEDNQQHQDFTMATFSAPLPTETAPVDTQPKVTKPKKPRSQAKNSRKRPTSSREMSATPKPEDRESRGTTSTANPYYSYNPDSDEEDARGGVSGGGGSSSKSRRNTAPAIPGTVNRRAVKEHIACVSCGAVIGILELRGSVVGITYTSDVKCKSCMPPAVESPPQPTISNKDSSTTTVSKGKKKRVTTASIPATSSHHHQPLLSTVPTSTHHTFPCLVCKSIMAQGTINEKCNDPAITTPSKTTASILCIPCDTKYMFCSECGGGGKQRTGKYRPRGLFPLNRKTCSLPHIRIGTAQVLYRVYDQDDQQQVISPGLEVLEGIRDVLFDCHVGLYAIPGVLEGFDDDEGGVDGEVRDKGLQGVFALVKKMWDGCVYNVVNGVGGGGVGKKMYLTTAWIEKMYRMKSKTAVGKKKKDSGGGVSAMSSSSSSLALDSVGGGGGAWMSKLELGATMCEPLTVADGDHVKMESLSASMNFMGDEGPSESGEGKTFVSFSVVEWDQSNGTLFIYHITPRTVNQTNVESYRDSLKQTIAHIESDPEYCNHPPLKHVWGWTRNSLHSRIRNVPERLGFMTVDEYLKVKENRKLQKRLFTKDGFAPLQEDGVIVYASSIKNFM